MRYQYWAVCGHNAVYRLRVVFGVVDDFVCNIERMKDVYDNNWRLKRYVVVAVDVSDFRNVDLLIGKVFFNRVCDFCLVDGKLYGFYVKDLS